MDLDLTSELSMLETQLDIHNLIVHQAPLDETLEAIADSVGLLVPAARVSIMRFDAESKTLSLVPSRHFSQSFTSHMQNLSVGLETCTCGATAHHRRLVITEDIKTDPCWDAFRDVAMAERFSSCWSSPVTTAQGELLGTFDIYYYQPTALSCATDMSTGQLRRAASLVALAVLSERDSRRFSSLAESHRSLFLNHPDGVYDFDLTGCFQHGNASMERISGYPAQSMIGRHFNEFVAPDYRQLTQAAFDAAKAGANRCYETRGIHADGHTYYLKVTNFPMIVGGKIVGVYGICRDITSRKHQEAQLLVLQRALESSPNGISISDAIEHDTPVVHVNDAFCRITGYTLEETLGKNLRFLQGPETSPAAVTALRRAVATRTEVNVTILNYRKDGTLIWTQMSINPIFDASGQCTHFIGTQQDVTRERNQAAKLAYQASHDLRTGLLNRTALDNCLEDELQKSQKNQCMLAVLHLDLDGFKPINDGLGYHIGNQLLIAVAERLRQLVSPYDTLAYNAGDEFIILMPNVSVREDVAIAAKRILNAFDHSFEVDGHTLHISTSVGIACSDQGFRQANELLQHADLAVDLAKKQGRNTWHWYQGKGTQVISEHVLLRHDLHAALRDNEFELYYQPIVEAVSGRIRSVEALIRWHHPAHGIVSPGIFIPIAEQTGQIIPLGLWVLRQACETLADLHVRGERALPVAVNISPLQFRRNGFLDDVQRILDETGLPPELLELEITEGILLGGAEHAIEIIKTLRRMGISIAIDDFGTGFSSLSYLRDLPINKIKLDRAFIQDILTCRSSAALVQGIITMAHHMGLIVVAEGIETAEHQQDLVHRECDLLQGFLFSRPVPLGDLMALPEDLTVNGWFENEYRPCCGE